MSTTTRIPAQSDYARVERAIRFLEAHAGEHPALCDVAAELGLGESHVQRLFQRWAGVSPKKFVQLLTLRDAKQALAETRSVLEASLETGLSGSGRLHDLFLSLERLTPGEYKAGAAGLTVRWSVAETPLGRALFAALDRGLCGLFFLTDDGEAGAREDLERRWPKARLVCEPRAVAPYVEELCKRMQGRAGQPLSLVLKGTSLQLKVWEALLRIPEGGVLSYQDVATWVGAGRASRAVGGAVGRNPIAWLIPCHRVIQSTGVLGGYRWGSERKMALLTRELGHRAPRPW
jgi:AraC family transcriptional regulator of adaptative response/methylated-DNA-[protein]-cysteine methyltransferase